MGIVDKAKHTAEEALGKAKEAAGDAVGNEDMKSEGQKQQVESDAKQANEQAKDAARDR